VLCTYSFEQQVRTRSILDENGIESRVTVKNIGIRNYGEGSPFSNDRFWGLNSRSNEYKVFVHREDYERALVALRAGKI